MSIDPVALASNLVRCRSVTPEDSGALDVLEAAIRPLGFDVHRLRFEAPGTAPVDNIWARLGPPGHTLVFAGHTDVVPPGTGWAIDPFGGTVRDGRLWGRGAADMKSAIAAFVAAVSEVTEGGRRRPPGGIALLITGDEEGPAVNGTAALLRWLAARRERMDVCLVGEPTNPSVLGQMMKIGRRGSMTGHLTVRGTQGHVAYPQRADNPLPRLVRMLTALTAAPLDSGNAYFEPSSLQITTIDVGNPATNVIPAEGRAVFNIRFNDLHTSDSLKTWAARKLAAVDGAFELRWEVSGEAFLTKPGPWVRTVAGAVEAVTGVRPELSTSGGTSDARFIQAFCPVVEFGGVGASMHKADENQATDDIRRLAAVYREVIRRHFADA
jgi:succinyl-diaminopimelate desuccinylase